MSRKKTRCNTKHFDSEKKTMATPPPLSYMDGPLVTSQHFKFELRFWKYNEMFNNKENKTKEIRIS